MKTKLAIHTLQRESYIILQGSNRHQEEEETLAGRGEWRTVWRVEDGAECLECLVQDGTLSLSKVMTMS